MVGIKDLCVDCSELVGGGPSQMPHAALGPNPLRPEERNSFTCLTCKCGWGVNVDSGWRRTIDRVRRASDA